jgi:hypothetical protein
MGIGSTFVNPSRLEQLELDGIYGGGGGEGVPVGVGCPECMVLPGITVNI